jgi:hypothetical protein
MEAVQHEMLRSGASCYGLANVSANTPRQTPALARRAVSKLADCGCSLFRLLGRPFKVCQSMLHLEVGERRCM